MIAKAKARYLHESPMKVRHVIDLIRGKDVLSSLTILTHVNKECTKQISKLLNSAISNAKQKGLLEEQLVISRITADHGPKMKRWRAASFGRAKPIEKKTTHLMIELDLKTEKGVK